jgi:glycosyltransferase involved in cell wall biosynthesis
MIIHYYQQFFTGPNAPGTLTPRKLMQHLAGQGHTVHVVATDFNVYNEQTEPPEDYALPSGGRLVVHRVPSARGLRRGLRARLHTYVGFAWAAYRLGRQLPRPDVVLGSIQPLFTGLVAQRVAHRCHASFLLEIRDLWPDALEAKGAISHWQAWPLHLVANYLYRAAESIISLTPGIKSVLLKKGVPQPKVDVIPNGYDPAMYDLLAGTREQVRAELGWERQFVAVFTGTHVEVTAVETIVKAAECLKHRTDIRFDLFGKGQRKPAAVALARSLGIANIHFHDPVPKNRIPGILAAADVGLMTLFKSPLIDIYFENKLVDYMGAGKAILAAMDGMQGRLIATHKAGRVVGSFDYQGLAKLVEDAANDPEQVRQMGANGKWLATEHLRLPDILGRYTRLLEAAAAVRPCQTATDVQGHTLELAYPWYAGEKAQD